MRVAIRPITVAIVGLIFTCSSWSVGEEGSAALPSAHPNAGAAPSDPPRHGHLTLEQAITLAQRLNDTREVAAARLAQALAARRQALSGLLPVVSAGGQLEKYSVSTVPFAHNIGDADGLAVNLTLTLFNATNVDQVRAASAVVSAQTLDSTDLRRTLAFQVTTSFLTTIAAEKVLVAAIEARDVARLTADQTHTRAKVGVASANDATRTDLTVASAELIVTQDRQTIVAARFSLGDLIGRAVDEELVEPDPAQVPSRDFAQLERLGLTERPDLASSLLRIRATDLQARGTRLGILPIIGVRGSYLLNSSWPVPTPADSPEWQVAASATWLLYDGGNREATADLYDQQAREAYATLRLARHDLHRDVGTALGALSTAETAVSQAEVEVKVARLNESEILTRYKQGADTALDAADATAQVYQAQSDLANRQLDLGGSRFQLRQLIGRWPLSNQAPPEEHPPGPLAGHPAP